MTAPCGIFPARFAHPSPGTWTVPPPPCSMDAPSTSFQEFPMQALGCLGNVLWFFPFGLGTGLLWCIADVFCFISIIGIP